MSNLMYFDEALFAVTHMPSSRVKFTVSTPSGHKTLELSQAEASRLAAALNDFAARSAPVCDEAEG